MHATPNGTLATSDRLRIGAALVRRCLGWLFLTQGYLDSLSTEEVLARGLGERKARRYFEAEWSERAAAEGILGSAAAEARRLGQRYREAVQANAVTGVVMETRLDREQRALLHSKKTPLSGQFRAPEPT
jgi:hypothetical protein